MRPRKPKKPRTIRSSAIKPRAAAGGSAGIGKSLSRLAKIAALLDRERQRHHKKLASLAERRLAALIMAPARRATALARVGEAVIAEVERHRERVADLERRLREARR